MIIQRNISLKPYNTFGIEVITSYFTEVFSSTEISDFLNNHHDRNLPLLVLGGGSNILLTENFNGNVLKISSKGIEKVYEDNDFIHIKSQAGESWENFVNYCISMDWAGLENLSLIPGNVGTSPMQNIGAYGVEIKDVFFELEAIHINSGEIRKFNKEECCFGYRYSVFKGPLKEQFIISTVTFKLRREPTFNTSYGAVSQELERMGIKELTIKAIGEAVSNIRRSKLPDPAEMGNAGSFFKNPVISEQEFQNLKQKYPDIASYPTDNQNVKIAAGWLIEKAGWKGRRIGNCGVHEKQALVLVNYGGATGKEILHLANQVIFSVKNKFGVDLEMEVNVV